MPNFIHYTANLDPQENQTVDLDLELKLCTECVDNIDLHFRSNHILSTNGALESSHFDDDEDQTIGRSRSRSSYESNYLQSIPKPFFNSREYESPGSQPLSNESSITTALHKLNQSPISAQTCVDSFYTPSYTTLPPIIGMRDLQNSQYYGEPVSGNMHDTKVNDNDFHFPTPNSIDLPNGYLPWDSELNDSDCDDGMFESEHQKVEDMHTDNDSISQPAKSEIIPSYTADEQTHNLFMDAFIQNNRLDSVSQVMGYHPDYLRIFLSTQHFLLREDGPLRHDCRHYIAIMAAARHHCTYLVELHEQDFLFRGGDPEWLKGLDHAPRKLRDLSEINKLLAHQPWLITKDHMLKLLKSSEPWSLSELTHAIVLLTHFHALCSFVFGCGISSEVDSQGGHTYLESVLTSTAPSALSTTSSSTTSSSTASDTTTITSSPSSTTTATTNNTAGATSNGCSDVNSNGNCQMNGFDTDVCVKALMEKMRQVQEAPSGVKSVEERIKQFNKEGKSTAEIAVPNSKQSASKSEISEKYLQDTEFAYTDFANRECSAEVGTFCACDYSWEDHGFSLANRLYTDCGNYLDDKYSTAANMTYYTMGDLREVDTSSFRRAIWNYIHIMYGICHDDYDYSEVNQLLEIKLKAYIKTLTCYPERLKKKDFDGVMKGFQHSEKVHVNLMLMEARQQAELLYALRALNSYLS